MPEEAQKDVPPSYASAQADSVPPYWETTVHAPSSPGAFGEMIIDALPTGSLFSFLWNMLVSISFQFVGFLLTYLLHTTHAARFGSRAGLGVTLIQYGFALRSRAEDAAEADATWGWRMGGNGQMQQPPATGAPDPSPTFDTAAQAEDYYRNLNMSLPDPATAIPPATMDEINLVNDATTDWLSFFLMTIGASRPRGSSAAAFAHRLTTRPTQAGSSCSRRSSASGASSAGRATSSPRSTTPPPPRPPPPRATRARATAPSPRASSTRSGCRARAWAGSSAGGSSRAPSATG